MGALMSQMDLTRELVSTYRKHGWELRHVLAGPSLQEVAQLLRSSYGESISLQDSAIDALWFSRPSHGGREAWELRLVSENPYALFETFEPDETEELRAEARLEMEARMREKLAGSF